MGARRRAVRLARRGAQGYLRLVTAGPQQLLRGSQEVSSGVWAALVGAPVFALLSLVLAVVLTSFAWVAAGLFAALTTAVLLVLVVKVRRYERKQYPYRAGGGVGSAPRTGARGTSVEGRIASAVGMPVTPSMHDAGGRVPRVTVVVACFNDAHFLGAALHSVQQQSIEDWECVVIDDASTDESFDVALAFAERDTRFSVVVHDKNRGLSAARNTGTALARGQYVMFLDSDDFLYGEALEARLDRIDEGTGCIGAYCDWRSVPEDAGYVSRAERPAAQRPTVHLMTLGFDVPFIASAPIVRTDVMRAAGGFDETLPTAEDADMWSRLLRGGVWFTYAPYVGIAYRQRSGSMVRRSPLGHFDVVKRVTDRLSERWDSPWPGAPAPLTEPLDEYLEDMALLPRRLNFLSLHVALHGSQGVEERHVPSREARSLPHYETLVSEQADRALRRLGRHSRRELEVLTEQVLAVAPPYRIVLEPRVPQEPVRVRGRALRPGIRRIDVEALRSGEPVFLLAPQSRYHVAEVGPLLEALRDRGIRTEVYLPPEAPVSVGRELTAYVDHAYAGDPAGLMGAPLLGAFMLNDWGANMQAVMAAVKAFGGTSFAKVEGVQDFEDADTGRVRRAYQHADVVLGQGQNDVDALPGQDVRVVGSTRLERLWAGPPVLADNGRVLINFNFTYGVLTEKQDEWIWAAVDGARSLGLEYEISLHPAQKNVPPEPAVMAHISADPFSHALRRSGVLVSRFSTVLYEAMAIGVPALYLNSHGEKVPTFQDPGGAFMKVTSTDLGPGLTEALSWRGDYRSRSEAFFRRQVHIDPDRPSEQRAADVISKLVVR
ncbi:MAG TPA: glycosyltransferase family A protein [Mycobacteriales bacterium]|nr:glycosyltransferase family A protein [Mycobacteriales bacterium]